MVVQENTPERLVLESGGGTAITLGAVTVAGFTALISANNADWLKAGISVSTAAVVSSVALALAPRTRVMLDANDHQIKWYQKTGRQAERLVAARALEDFGDVTGQSGLSFINRDGDRFGFPAVHIRDGKPDLVSDTIRSWLAAYRGSLRGHAP